MEIESVATFALRTALYLCMFDALVFPGADTPVRRRERALLYVILSVAALVGFWQSQDGTRPHETLVMGEISSSAQFMLMLRLALHSHTGLLNRFGANVAAWRADNRAAVLYALLPLLLTAALMVVYGAEGYQWFNLLLFVPVVIYVLFRALLPALEWWLWRRDNS